jgi:hypothetical protein
MTSSSQATSRDGNFSTETEHVTITIKTGPLNTRGQRLGPALTLTMPKGTASFLTRLQDNASACECGRCDKSQEAQMLIDKILADEIEEENDMLALSAAMFSSDD